MSRTSLNPGETTIDTVDIVERPPGTLYMQWRICYPDGKVEKRITKGKKGRNTKGSLRRRAHEQAEELLRAYGSDTTWKPSSLISDYIESETMPAIEATERLRPRTKASYLSLLRHFRDRAKGYRIAEMTRVKTLKVMLSDIAKEHGSESAKHVKKVVSKYVMRSLVEDQLIPVNPLRDIELDLEKHKVRELPSGGQALSPDDHENVIAYLLSIDPSDIPEKRQGRYTQEDLISKRKLTIDVTLLQATTGLRISEVRLLRRKRVLTDRSPISIEIDEDVSKTHKGRIIPILDARVESRVKERLDLIDESPDALVFAAPAKPDSIWDSTNCQKALKKLYGEIADELGIPLLKQVGTHVWRTTLNNKWMGLGVPDIIRSAYFGHSEEVNRRYYTDLTDISPLLDFLKPGGA